MKNTKGDPKTIKSCFSHIGGKFGERLAIRFEALGWIIKETETRHYRITKKGEREFHNLGVDLSDL